MSATLPGVLARGHDTVAPALHAAIDTLSSEVRLVAGYHVGIVDADGTPTDAGGGKALRPCLALLACEAVGGDATEALPAALAVQLVHDFSLLHDDVMDDDVERRHRPTAWTVFGVGPAILAGDALLALAMDVLLEDPTPRRVEASRWLTDATAQLIAGQGQDLAFEHRDDVTVADCLAMCGGKTAALLEASTAMGAVLGGAPAGTVARFGTYGRELGLAFQAVDDLLGIWGRSSATGKPVHSDLYQRKRSLPVVAALSAGGPRADELAGLLHQPRLDDAAVARMAQLVDANGGRELTRLEATSRLDRALAALDDLDLDPAAHAELIDLAQFIVDREL